MSVGLRCPECGHDVTKVLDTRIRDRDGSRLRRRRDCCGCGARFSTVETLSSADNASDATLEDIRAIATKLLQMLEAMKAPELKDTIGGPEIKAPPPVPKPRPRLKPQPTKPPAPRRWCDQCEQRVDAATVARCGSRFCSLKPKNDTPKGTT